jgi:hypothetical protein
MFDASDFFAELAASGVRLDLDESGRIKVTGHPVARERWLPEIRQHKTQILARLDPANHADVSPISIESDTIDSSVVSTDYRRYRRYRRWLIVNLDGIGCSHSFTPPATRSDVERWYPGGLVLAREP